MKALQEARKLSRGLAEQFPYERASLFGSVLKKGRFTRHSDIDIVIKGLDGTLFLRFMLFFFFSEFSLYSSLKLVFACFWEGMAVFY